MAFAKTNESGKPTLKAESEKYIGRKLRAMVAKGEITREQAREKMEGFSAKTAGDIDIKLRAMVAKGEITSEQFREKMEVLRAGKAGGYDKKNLAGIERRIAAAVEAGKLTQKEADDRLAGYQRGLQMDKKSKAECGDWK